MSDLLALVEKHLGASWLQIIAWLKENNSLDDIAARLEAHDIDGAIAELDTAAERFAADVHAGYIEAGQQTAEWLDGEVGTDAIVRFDVANERAVAWAERNSLDKIRGITQDQRDTIRQVISDGLSRGANPREVARDLRGSVGLTAPQAEAVASYRRALESQDYANALERQLSDGRSDRSIASAQRRDIALTPEQVDTAVERYAANQLTFRAETIARTEGLRAVHQGNEEALRQAVDRGDVQAETLLREWNHAGGGRYARPGHVAMDGDQQPFGEPFENPLTGAMLRYPGDPDVDASETANCRCTLATRYRPAKAA